VLKPSAASPQLMKHRGRAVVFESIEEYKERIEDPALEIDETSVMVLKNCGPKGYPGMAEVGNMGLPPKLLARGITDMVRISDARMSGTAYGTVVLHVCPEAAWAGPWRWCARATGLSWMWRRGGCIWMWTMRSWNAAARGVGCAGAGIQERVPVALCEARDAGPIRANGF
jgi:hypothetical protein